jgi:hypothetical protein
LVPLQREAAGDLLGGRHAAFCHNGFRASLEEWLPALDGVVEKPAFESLTSAAGMGTQPC